MVYTLKITNFIDQIMAKMAAIDQSIEQNPTITAEIDYHKMEGKRVLLSNEYRELANDWNSLQTQGLTSHMHGMRSIISRVRHQVMTALARSHRMLQKAIEMNPKIRDGGPPDGVPITPAMKDKPSPTLKPGGIRKEKDCYTIEVITLSDDKAEGEENSGDKHDHENTHPREAATRAEPNNDEKNAKKQVGHETGRANMRRVKQNAVEKAEVDVGIRRREAKTAEQTGPQYMRLVKNYCNMIKREARLWVANERKDIEKRKERAHWKPTEKHSVNKGDSLRKQLSDCSKLLEEAWQKNIAVFSTIKDGHVERKYARRRREIESLREDIIEVENKKANAQAENNGNTSQPKSQTVWSEKHSAETKLNLTEELQPMSNKIIVQDPAGESDGREIDKDDLLAWYDRNIKNKKCLPPDTQHVREVIRLAERPSPKLKGSAICLPDGSDKFFIGTDKESLDNNMIRVNLPYTKRNQYWYTVNVNRAQPRVVCQEAKVTLDKSVLKKLATMSRELGLMAKIPIIKNGEDNLLGAYAHPHLSPHVMIGPFAQGRGRRDEKQQHIGQDAAEPPQQYPPNWLGTRGSFIKEPIIYEDMTGKLVYITP